MSQRTAFGRVPCMDTAGLGRGSKSEDERGNIADTTVDRRVCEQVHRLAQRQRKHRGQWQAWCAVFGRIMPFVGVLDALHVCLILLWTSLPTDAAQYGYRGSA